MGPTSSPNMIEDDALILSFLAKYPEHPSTTTRKPRDIDFIKRLGNYSIEKNNLMNVTAEYPYEYAEVMFGYFLPIILIITVITNTIVVMVLAKKQMRTPTNIIIMSMAICDSLTLLSPAPWYIYIYTMGYHDGFLYPPELCYTYYLMTDVIPTMFHTASIWLSVLLAATRYIYVCHPTRAVTWCTVPKVKRAMITILVASLLHQSTRFIDQRFEVAKGLYKGQASWACKNNIMPWVYKVDDNVYFGSYYTFRVLFVYLFSIVASIVLNYLIIFGMRDAEIKRSELKMRGATNRNLNTIDKNIRTKRISKQKLSSEGRSTDISKICQSTSNRNSMTNNNDNSNNNPSMGTTNIELKQIQNDMKDGEDNNTTMTSAVVQMGTQQSPSNPDNKVTTSHECSTKVKQQVCLKEDLTQVIIPDPVSPTPTTQRRRRNVRTVASSRNSNSNRTTLMLIVINTVFLIVEVPDAIVTLLHLLYNSLQIGDQLDYSVLNHIKLITNFIIIVSYGLKYALYCGMSKQFRQTFRQMFPFVF